MRAASNLWSRFKMVNTWKKFGAFAVVFSLACLGGCVEQQGESSWSRTGSGGQELHAPERPGQSPPMDANSPKAVHPQGVINLGEALACALMSNPELGVFSWEKRVFDAKELQASLSPNPEFQAEVEDVGGSGERSGFDGAETTLQLSQLIEMGDKRRKRVEVASLEKRLAGFDYEGKRLDVLAKTTRSFVEVLAAQHRLELSDELVRLSEQLHNAVAQRVEAGKDSPVERTKAAVVLSTVGIANKQAKQNLDAARKQLAAAWGSGEPGFESVAGDLDSISALPSWGDLKELTCRNPDVARWDVELEHRRAALKLEKAKKISDVTVSGGMKRLGEVNDTALVFGISIPIPIFDRNQAGVLEARYELAKAVEQRNAAEVTIGVELSRAYQALSNAFTQATELKSSVLPGAGSVLGSAAEGYRQGKFDYLEVLDAQRTLFEARDRYIDALESYHTARADVERLIAQGIDEINK